MRPFLSENKYFLEEVNLNSEFSDFGAFEHEGKVVLDSRKVLLVPVYDL